MDKRKVLIVGANSYVGGRLKVWLESNNKYIVDVLDVKNDGINGFDFSSYGSIVFVAAIVHRKKNQPSYNEYHRINSLLPLEVAQIAKNQGVRHFVFISSMAVYGLGKKLPKGIEINEQTSYYPISHYGKSKLAGENLLKDLAANGFDVAIVRPPNIYGLNCPGNYMNGFLRITKILPFFPLVFLKSKQGLLYVDNLSELLCLIIETRSGGVFCPQDPEPISTVDLLKIISQKTGNTLRFSKVLGWAVYPFLWVPLVVKLFGGISYCQSLSYHFEGKYQVFTSKQGLELTLGRSK